LRPDDSFINDKQKNNLCVCTVSFGMSRGEVDSAYPSATSHGNAINGYQANI